MKIWISLTVTDEQIIVLCRHIQKGLTSVHLKYFVSYLYGRYCDFQYERVPYCFEILPEYNFAKSFIKLVYTLSGIPCDISFLIRRVKLSDQSVKTVKVIDWLINVITWLVVYAALKIFLFWGFDQHTDGRKTEHSPGETHKTCADCSSQVRLERKLAKVMHGHWQKSLLV